MCFDEQAVGTCGHGGAGDCFYHFRAAPSYASGGVGLLQGVGAVHNHRAPACLLHAGDAAEVDHKVAVAECCATFGNHHVVVAGSAHFFGGEAHGFGSHELSFLDVHGFAGVSGGNQQVGLAAQEGGNLEYVGEFRGHCGLSGLVDVGYHRHSEFAACVGENLEGFEVADAAEGVQTAAVSLSVAALQCERYAQARAHFLDVPPCVEYYFLAFYRAGTGYEEEAGAGTKGFQCVGLGHVSSCSVD